MNLQGEISQESKCGDRPAVLSGAWLPAL